MANKRMFSNTITDSDLFLSMPLSSQALYFHYGMKADDEGFVGNPMSIVRMISSSIDDYKLLKAKGFIIEFESGVIVITHWKQNNYLQNDRVKPTLYKTERSLLVQDKSGVYMLKASMEITCIQNVYSLDTECIRRKEENRKEENREEESLTSMNNNEIDNSYARDDSEFLRFSNVMDRECLESEVEGTMWVFLSDAKKYGVEYNEAMLALKIRKLNKRYGTDTAAKRLQLVRDYSLRRFDPNAEE